jgi:hypothetical protein
MTSVCGLFEAARAEHASRIHTALATAICRLAVLENISANRRHVVAGLQLGQCLLPSCAEDQLLDDVNDRDFCSLFVERTCAYGKSLKKSTA